MTYCILLSDTYSRGVHVPIYTPSMNNVEACTYRTVVALRQHGTLTYLVVETSTCILCVKGDSLHAGLGNFHAHVEPLRA